MTINRGDETKATRHVVERVKNVKMTFSERKTRLVPGVSQSEAKKRVDKMTDSFARASSFLSVDRSLGAPFLPSCREPRTRPRPSPTRRHCEAARELSRLAGSAHDPSARRSRRPAHPAHATERLERTSPRPSIRSRQRLLRDGRECQLFPDRRSATATRVRPR